MTAEDVTRKFSIPGQEKDVRAGSVTLSTGSATQATGLTTVDGWIVKSNTANRAYATESSGTLTFTGTGSDVVYWWAWGKK